MTGEDGLGSRRGAASAPQKAHVTGAYGKPVAVMNENRRCSIVFHLLVPGGKWPTVMGMPSSSARFCTAEFLDDEIMHPHVLWRSLGAPLHPPFLKSSTSSFSLVSIEIAGSPAASASVTRSLI
jgi:hypothetical protein